MPRPFTPIPANFDNWINRYEAGESFPKLAQECGVSSYLFRRWLTERQVNVRSQSEGLLLGWQARPKRIGNRMDIAAAAARYRKGASMLELQRATGVSRETIKTALVAHGVHVRNRSEAEHLSWQKGLKTASTQTSAAWDAVRGNPASDATLNKQAVARGRTLSEQGQWEADIIDALRYRGIKTVPQLPVGKYNLDIAIEKPLVAVEVYRSTPKPDHDSAFAKRSQYLLDRGWWLLMILECRSWFNLDALTDKVVAFMDLARKDESAICKHGVVRGDGQPFTGRCSKINYLPQVESF